MNGEGIKLYIDKVWSSHSVKKPVLLLRDEFNAHGTEDIKFSELVENSVSYNFTGPN